MRRIFFSSLNAALETNLEMIHSKSVDARGLWCLMCWRCPKAGWLTAVLPLILKKRGSLQIFLERHWSCIWRRCISVTVSVFPLYHYLCTKNKSDKQKKRQDWGFVVKVEFQPSGSGHYRSADLQLSSFLRFLWETAEVRSLIFDLFSWFL